MKFEMKDSGIDWIGNIPKEWQIERIGGLYSVRNTKVNDFDFQPLSVTKQGVLPQLENAAKSNDHNNRKLVKIGDFAINSRSDRRGSCGISNYDGSVSLINTVLKPNINMYSQYFNWLFHTNEFADEFYKWGHGIVNDLWTTNWEQMKKINVCFPNLDEQEKIAVFLDNKCSKIDKLISDINKQIEVLEQYKRSVITEAVTKGLNPIAETSNSDVFYIGEINANWKKEKIGYICQKLTRGFESSDTALICSNKGQVLIRPEDMIGKMVSEDNAMQGIKKGDIAIHGMDTWHGAIAISNYDGKITRVVHVCQSKIDNRFIVYYLQHLAYQGVYKLISNGVRGNTSDFRSWEKVKDICIYIPNDNNETKNICDYLDRKVEYVNGIVEEKRKLIEIIDNYKKSLIFEYVTGKKRVI